MPALLAPRRPTLARLLDRMERDGLIIRVPDPDDRRANRVEVTANGRALMRPVADAISAVRQQALGGLDEAELARLVGLLARIQTALAEPGAPAGTRTRTAPRRPAAAPRAARH